MFNELMVSIYLYVLLTLTDFNLDEDLYDGCGIALLSVVMVSFIVNFLKFVILLLHAIYIRVKLWCMR